MHVKCLPQCLMHNSKCSELTSPEPQLHYLALTPLEAIFLCLNHPRTGYQATRDHAYSLEPAVIIQTNQS